MKKQKNSAICCWHWELQTKIRWSLCQVQLSSQDIRFSWSRGSMLASHPVFPSSNPVKAHFHFASLFHLCFVSFVSKNDGFIITFGRKCVHLKTPNLTYVDYKSIIIWHKRYKTKMKKLSKKKMCSDRVWTWENWVGGQHATPRPREFYI